VSPAAADIHLHAPARSCAGETDSMRQGEACVSIRLDMEAIDALQLDIDSQTVKWSILGTPRIKLKEQHVRCVGHDKLLVLPPDESRAALLFQLEALLLSLPKVGPGDRDEGVC
jgi:hypothetical protein